MKVEHTCEAFRCGGRVYGRWPGLDPSQLNEAATWCSPPTSAAYWAKVYRATLAMRALATVFLGFANSPHGFLRYLG